MESGGTDGKMQNGIAIHIHPNLGLSVAGNIWTPVPDDGVPAEMLALVTHRNGYEKRLVVNALCTREQFDGQFQHHQTRNIDPLSVTIPGWAGVVAAYEALRSESEQEAADLATANATADARIAEYRAAIADQNPSRLLKSVAKPWGDDWSTEYDIYVSGLDTAHRSALERAWEDAKKEAAIRDRASKVAFGERVSALPDDEFFAAASAVDYRVRDESGISKRYDGLCWARDAAKKSAEKSVIRLALVSYHAPDHVVERFDDGCLPDDERDEHLRPAAFAAITLPEYAQLVDSDLDHDDDCGGSDPSYSSKSYTGDMDSEEWIAWKSAKSSIEAAGFEPQLRRTLMTCDNCSAHMYRLKARATAKIAGITVWRDYAIG